MLPQKLLKLQSPKMRISEFWELNWGEKSLFFIQENVALIQLSIYQLHNKFLQAKNKLWKLHHILLLINKFSIKVWKIDWNIAFSWLKDNVKPVGFHESTSWLCFHSHLMIYFVNNVINYFKLYIFLAKSSQLLWTKWPMCFVGHRRLLKPLDPQRKLG